MREFSTEIHEAMTLENELFDALTHLLDGFKEIKMSESRSAALLDNISAISDSVKDVKANAVTRISVVSILLRSAFYPSGCSSGVSPASIGHVLFGYIHPTIYCGTVSCRSC